MRSFTNHFIDCLNKNMYNFHIDNHDVIRYPGKRKTGLLKLYLIRILSRMGLNIRNLSFTGMGEIMENYQGLEGGYNVLEDNASKELYVNLLALKVLGAYKIKLKVNTPSYWQMMDKFDRSAIPNEFVRIKRKNAKINLYDLTEFGYPYKLYISSGGIMAEYYLEQYSFKQGEVTVMAKPGDYVIDAGGCWGDSAIYFAHKVGSNGHVYSFEFIPSNISLLQRNLSMNNGIKDLIEVIDKPLWSVSDLEMYYKDNGPGSRVSFDPIHEANKTQTVSIDDLVNSGRIKQVDFIKMDIEGAEYETLKGAVNTIKRFKPKLAISIYHDIKHFYEISELINNLNIGYKFYLDHFTINNEETVLFAKVE